MRDLLNAAVARRAHLSTASTNALRLIDGEGDGLAGLILESYANRWLVSTKTQVISPVVLEWLRDQQISCYGKRLDQHQKDSPDHLCGPELHEPFLILENGARFEISFQSGYSQGIFLDQRDNRAEVYRRMKPGLKLLNTFSYTGAFSIYAALAGAETTTLDLSQPYLNWARRNFSHNGMDPADHHFCKGDTFHWLGRFAKQGRRFDGIVLDPPTFSRDENGRVFRVEKDFGELAALAEKVLAPNGWLLCCTNFRGMTPLQFELQLVDSMPRSFKMRHAKMPHDFTDVPYLKTIWMQ